MAPLATLLPALPPDPPEKAPSCTATPTPTARATATAAAGASTVSQRDRRRAGAAGLKNSWSSDQRASRGSA